MPVPNVPLEPYPLASTGVFFFFFPEPKVSVTWAVEFCTGFNIGFLQKDWSESSGFWFAFLSVSCILKLFS